MATVRRLRPDEYNRLVGIMPEDLWIPDPSISSITIAEEADEIVGFWVAQSVVHLEPVWIKPERRGGTILGEMWKEMRGGLTRAYAFSTCEKISGYLERLGFRPNDYRVFEVEGSQCRS